MTTRAATLGETLEILWDIWGLKKDEAVEKIKRVGKSYAKALLYAVLLWVLSASFLIYLKAITGVKIFAFLAAILSLLFAIGIRILWAPINICLEMMIQETINPAKANEDYVKKSAIFVLIGLSASFYAMNNPIENNPSLLMELGIAFVALVLLVYIAGSVISVKFYTVAIGLYIIYATLLFRTDEPINYLLNGCNPPYSMYQGQRYGKYESIAVTHPYGKFSDLITLSGKYDIIFTEWIDILPEGSKKQIRFTKNPNVSVSKLRVRTDSGLAMFIPLAEK